MTKWQTKSITNSQHEEPDASAEAPDGDQLRPLPATGGARPEAAPIAHGAIQRQPQPEVEECLLDGGLGPSEPLYGQADVIRITWACPYSV